MRRLNQHVTVKSILGVIVPLVIFSTVASIIGYNSFTKALLNQYAEGAFLTAQTAAELVDADRMDEYAQSGGTTEMYREVWDRMDHLCNSSGSEFIYVIQPDRSDYGHITFLFSTINHKGTNSVFKFGHVRETSNDEYREKYRALYDQESEQELLIRDKGNLETGSHITAIISLKGSDGQVKALLCVQRQMDVLQRERNEYLNNVAMVLVFLITLVVLGQSLYLHKVLLRPLALIIEESARFSTENTPAAHKLQETIRNRDEIGQLASSLEYMASELQKLDDYRKAFISNISHDFRSPLTSIKCYAEAMIDGTIPPEKQDRYLSIIVDETKRLSKLTSSLLELNDFDSYGIWLMPKAFDVIDLVKGAINTYEGRCIEKGVSIILNNHAKDTVVYADKMKIQQVIYNLLDNAFKFTPAGKKIYFTLVDKGDKIFISVKDEGMGISRDDIKKIWTRFYKTDASRGKDKNGTGLGLSITKEIIKAHKENIDVVSTEGVGSEFTFTLTKAEAMGKKQTDITDILTADKKGK